MKIARIMACGLALCMVCAIPAYADTDNDGYSIEVYNDLETTAAATTDTQIIPFWNSSSTNWRAWGNPDMAIDEALTAKADAEADKYYSLLIMTTKENDPSKINDEAAHAQRMTITDEATAQAAMTTVTIPVWHLSGDTKVPATTTVTVMSSIADDVVAIFTEIYNGPEQFPISDIGGYSWRGSLTSNHSSGCALDINVDQNYQVRADGTALVGSCWLPGENPYSIKGDGDVAKAFAAHGWYWGAEFSTMDFMHFDAPVWAY